MVGLPPQLPWGDPVALAACLLAVDSPIGEERALCDGLHQHLDALNPHALVRAGNSLCIVPRAPRPGCPRLMLVGHLDTVPGLGDNPVRRSGDRLFGLGASDMKGAVAVILHLIERATREPPRHDLVAVLYSREEGPYDESELPLLRAAAPEWFAGVDLALVMEPTDGDIELGALGTCSATVRFDGQRAHSARPWQGDNAIHKAHGLLSRLAATARVPHEFHGLTFFEVVSATGIAFRGAHNVVPDRCEVHLNHRFAPGQTEADVGRRLDQLVAGEGALAIGGWWPSGLVCGDNPLLAELRGCAPEAQVGAKQAWTDVGRLSLWGIDAVNWGPGQKAQAHQAGEWASMAAIRNAAEVLGRWQLLPPGRRLP